VDCVNQFNVLTIGLSACDIFCLKLRVLCICFMEKVIFILWHLICWVVVAWSVRTVYLTIRAKA
jgi:hypothetical protein